jgi:hypothetical protein
MNDQQLARDVLRAALRDGDATPADRIRAAQLLLAAGDAPAAIGDALAADDQELLRIARGDSPPREGPAHPGQFSVPSEAQGEFARGDVPGYDAPYATGSDSPGAGGTRGKGDPKEDPFGRKPMSELLKGTQKRTHNLQSAPKNAQNEVDPWE